MDTVHENKILFGHPEGKRRLPSSTCGWEDNIKTNYKFRV